MADAPKQRISTVSAILMIMVAVIIDVAQFFVAFIPGVDVVLDFMLGVLGIFIFGIWFMFKGVNYFSGSKSGTKLASIFGTAIIELIPLVDALPGTTIGVATLIYATRAEDKEKIEKAAAVITPSLAVAGRGAPLPKRQYVWPGRAQAANDNENEAANDNEDSQEYQAAA